MDGQEYLNQISGAVKATQGAEKPSWLGSPIFKVLAIGVVGLIIIMIIGMILGSGGDSFKERCFALKLKLDNTISVIGTYQNDVKSSELRSYSASLSGVLSNTNREFENYLVEKYDYKAKSVSQKITDKAALDMEELSNDLFEAKINGILDRIYAHKMSYEISLIASEEASLMAATKDATLRTVFETSQASLNNLYENFNNFSETK